LLERRAHEADDRRENDADDRHEQRVRKADPERTTVTGGRIVGDQGLGDIEAGGVIPEAEARGDVLLLQIVDGVRNHHPEECTKHEDDDDLADHLTSFAPMQPCPQRTCLGCRGSSAMAIWRAFQAAFLVGGRHWSALACDRGAPEQISEWAARTGCRLCSTGC
jgi:hypothetical protein